MCFLPFSLVLPRYWMKTSSVSHPLLFFHGCIWLCFAVLFYFYFINYLNHSILPKKKKKEHSHHSYICRIFLFPFCFLTYDKYTVHFSCFCVSQIRLHFCFSSQWFGGAPFLFFFLLVFLRWVLFSFRFSVFFFFGTLASLWFLTAGVLSTTGDQPAPRCCFSFLRPSFSPLQTQPIKNKRKKIINTCICSVLCVCFPFFFL